MSWLKRLGGVGTRSRTGRAGSRRYRPRVDELEQRLLLSTFTVTNTDDNGGVNPAPFAGTGTLRQAIIDANATPGRNNIVFDIPGTDAHTIAVQAALPSVTNTVNILGNTQPGFGVVPQQQVPWAIYFYNPPFPRDRPPGYNVITLDGTHAGAAADGLILAAGSDGSQLSDLIVSSFAGNGMVVNNSADNTLFHLNVYYSGASGLLITGSSSHDNYLQNSTISGSGSDGVLISNGAHTNFLGVGVSTSYTPTNFIGNNRGNGVHIVDASNNALVYNDIGITYGANGGDGILVEGNCNGNLLGSDYPRTTSGGLGIAIAYIFPPVTEPHTNNSDIYGLQFGSGGLKVGRNALNGIEIRGQASNTDVYYATIGASSPANSSWGNVGNGILITTAGGGTRISNNCISGNAGNGIEVAGNAASVTIGDNSIGMDGAAMTAIGNAGDGILVHGNARNVVIGTDVYDYVVYFFGGCNLIAANKGNGITVAGNASQVSIHNNRIGIGAEIDVPMGNGGDGIAITSTAGNNSVVPMVVGGNGNVIVGNHGNGVWVTGSSGNAITSNEIYANGLLNIALTQGANNNQPAPLIDAAYNFGNQLFVRGRVAGPPNTALTIQLYDNSPGASAAAGLWLDELMVHTDATGLAEFTDSILPGRPQSTPAPGSYWYWQGGPINVHHTVPNGHVVTATVTDSNRNTSMISAGVTVRQLTTFTAPDAGQPPEVKGFLSDGTQVLDVMAYDPNFTGGVRVAVGDVTGDGVPEIVTAPGPGGGPDVKVFDGRNNALLAEFNAFDPNFTGGVNVAIADVNHDGFADVICGADAGGGPNIIILDGKGIAQVGSATSVLANFFAFDPDFTGGVQVAAADFNGDGFADLVAGPGAGGGPSVAVFDGKALAADQLTSLAAFFAFDPNFTGGVYVAAGDVNGDGTPDLIVGAGAGGGPNVLVLDGRSLSPAAAPTALANFFAYDPAFTGGVRVAAADVDGDGKADVVTGGGPGAAVKVQAFDAATEQLLDSFFAYDPSMSAGVYVAATSQRENSS